MRVARWSNLGYSLRYFPYPFRRGTCPVQSADKSAVLPMLWPGISDSVLRFPRLKVLRHRRWPTSPPFPRRLFDSQDSPTRKSRRCASNPLMSQCLWRRILRRIPLPKPAKTRLRSYLANRPLVSPRSFCPLPGSRPVAPNYWYESKQSFHRHSSQTGVRAPTSCRRFASILLAYFRSILRRLIMIEPSLPRKWIVSAEAPRSVILCSSGESHEARKYL